MIEFFYICSRKRSLFYFNYPERLRERPCDVLATCTTCYKGANSYLSLGRKDNDATTYPTIAILLSSPSVFCLIKYFINSAHAKSLDIGKLVH